MDEFSRTPLNDAFIQRMRALNISMGLGETCRVSGATPAQIRYWEKKGYVAASRHGEGQNKRYAYQDVLGIIFIKTMMDEGYTLARAAAEAMRHFDDIRVLKTLVLGSGLTVEHRDGHELVNLGPLANDAGYQVVAEVDNGVTLRKVAKKN